MVGEVKSLPKRDWGALKAPPAPAPRPAGGQSKSGSTRTGGGGGGGGGSGFGMNARNGESKGVPRHNDQRRGGSGTGGGQRGGPSHKGDQQRDKGPPAASNFGIKRPGNEPRSELPRRDWSNSRPGRNDNAAGPSRRIDETKPVGQADDTITEAPVDEIVYDANDQSDLAKQSRRRRAHTSAAEPTDDFTFNRGRAPKADPYARKGKYEQQNEQHALREERDRLKEQKAAERRQMKAKEEKQVLIPSNVTVSRLATIFGKKLCKLRSEAPADDSACAIANAFCWSGRG